MRRQVLTLNVTNPFAPAERLSAQAIGWRVMWVLPTGADGPDEAGNMSLGPEKTCVSNTGGDMRRHPLVQ